MQNSMNTKDTMDNEDPKLLKKASLRAGFKIHLGIFILVNLLCWVVWYFGFRGGDTTTSQKTMEASLFLSVAWTIILIGHFFVAYKWNKSMVEKELSILKKEMKEKEEELNKFREIENELDKADYNK